jgi:thymidylate synthase
VIEAPTLGAGWLETSRAILERGALERYDGQVTRELALLTLTIEHPSADDPLIAELGDAEWLAWMHENFFVEKDVPELGDAKSYAGRLFNYAGTGRDQIAWVVDRLRADPECRSASVTTFQPLTDTAYIPCVSLLDFWIRDGAVELVVYAHSLDFGKKAYGNLVELTRLSEHVAGELGRPVGRLVVHAKSAHVYEPEWAVWAELVALCGGRRLRGGRTSRKAQDSSLLDGASSGGADVLEPPVLMFGSDSPLDWKTSHVP